MCLSLPCRRHPSSAGSFCLEISFSFSLLFWNSDDVHCLELADPFLPWSCSQSQESHSHQLGRIYLRYRREKFGGGGGFKKNISAFYCWIFFFIISWVFLGLKLELIISHDPPVHSWQLWALQHKFPSGRIGRTHLFTTSSRVDGVKLQLSSWMDSSWISLPLNPSRSLLGMCNPELRLSETVKCFFLSFWESLGHNNWINIWPTLGGFIVA